MKWLAGIILVIIGPIFANANQPTDNSVSLGTYSGSELSNPTNQREIVSKINKIINTIPGATPDLNACDVPNHNLKKISYS